MSQLLWAERRRVLRVAIACAVVTLLVSLFMRNEYQAATRLMPPDKQSGSGMAALASMALGLKSGGASDIGSMAGDLLGMQGNGALFVGVLQSNSAQDKLVDRFDLQSVYGHPWLRLKAGRADARKELENNTEISEDRKSGIITLKVTDHDPKRASALAQAYVDQLNDLMAHLSTSSASRERVFLEGELTKVKKDLDDADKQLSQFSSTNMTLDPREQGKAMVTAASSLQAELIAAESSLRGLEAIYTSNNVRVRTLQARIAELKKQLANVSGGGVEGASDSTNEGTSSEFGFPSIRKLPLLSLTYADLYRKARIEETVYQILTQQYETAKVQEAKELPTVRVLDAAEIPEKKVGPRRGVADDTRRNSRIAPGNFVGNWDGSLAKTRRLRPSNCCSRTWPIPVSSKCCGGVAKMESEECGRVSSRYVPSYFKNGSTSNGSNGHSSGSNGAKGNGSNGH